MVELIKGIFLYPYYTVIETRNIFALLAIEMSLKRFTEFSTSVGLYVSGRCYNMQPVTCRSIFLGSCLETAVRTFRDANRAECTNARWQQLSIRRKRHSQGNFWKRGRLLRTIDLCPRNFWFIGRTNASRGASRVSNDGGIITVRSLIETPHVKILGRSLTNHVNWMNGIIVIAFHLVAVKDD